MHVLLGIDDTDVLGQRPGTGRLARDLGAHIEQHAMGRLVGVIRHQLLVDPRIPYTSHNSPACLIVEGEGGSNGAARRLFAAAADYVVQHCAQGSDPGICLVEQTAVGLAIQDFGRRAGSEVLAKSDALDLARQHGLLIEELGGSGDGVIGALAAVGLTAEGNAGRFLELAGGLRELGERVTARELRRRGIRLLSVSRNGEPVSDAAVIATGDWVRPRLIAGQPVLLVEPTDDGWCCFDRKNKHPDSTEAADA